MSFRNFRILAAALALLGASCGTYKRRDLHIVKQHPAIVWETIRHEVPVDRGTRVMLAWDPAGSSGDIPAVVGDDGVLAFDAAKLVLLGIHEDPVPDVLYITGEEGTFTTVQVPFRLQWLALKAWAHAHPEAFHELHAGDRVSPAWRTSLDALIQDIPPPAPEETDL